MSVIIRMNPSVYTYDYPDPFGNNLVTPLGGYGSYFTTTLKKRQRFIKYWNLTQTYKL